MWAFRLDLMGQESSTITDRRDIYLFDRLRAERIVRRAMALCWWAGGGSLRFSRT